MDFQLSEDQQALVDGIRALCAGRLPIESVRAAEGAERVLSRSAWAELGEAGVFSTTLPEADGGVGLGLADAAVVFEELGAALIPGPLVGTTLAAGLVDGVAQGQTGVQVVTPSPVPGPVPLLVPHLGMVDALLVLPPPSDHGAPARLVSRAVLNDLARPVPQPLDPLTPLWALIGPLPDGDPVDATADQLRHHGAVLTAALQVGIASASVERAVAYAQGRRQFGRPIGSFQAIKHLCADMLVRAEVARSALWAAAVLTDQPDAVVAEAEAAGLSPAQLLHRSVAGAKLLADEAALTNTRACIQVHGGMGFTWEVPAHLYLKRARVLATEFGTSAAMTDTIAALL